MNDKHTKHITETFDEWLIRKYSEQIDEYNQTERFDRLAKVNPQKFGNLNSQFKKVASLQKQSKGKYNDPKWIYQKGPNKGKSRPAIDLKQRSGNPHIKRWNKTPITVNTELEKDRKKYGINEHDYAAITLGIGILDTMIHSNGDYKDYDYIYEYIDIRYS